MGRPLTRGWIGPAALALAGCNLFGGPSPATDAGSSRDAGPIPCGAITFFGECDGDVLRWCDDGSLAQADCAAYLPGAGTCLLVNDTYGYGCGVGTGDACLWTRPDGESFTVFCEAVGRPGCRITVDAQICTTSLYTCAEADVGTCRGEDAILVCQQGQPSVVPCDEWGGTCAVGRCEGVGAGGPCWEAVVSCAPGLACVDNTCVGAPPPTDGGIDAGTDAGSPPSCDITGDLIVRGRAQLDRFRDGGCTEVPGDLTVESTSLTDLAGLERLVRVGGALNLRRNASLASLAALSNLTSVETLEVFDCDALVDLRGLERMSTTGTDGVRVFENGSLASLDGLRGVRDTGLLIVRDNPNLTSLRGLESLAIATAVDVIANPRLANLNALSSLGEVRHLLRIQSNGVGDVNGLGGLLRVGALDLALNTSLTSVSLPSLARIDEGDLTLSMNTALTGLSLPSLTVLAGDLDLRGNSRLSECVIDSLVTQLRAAGWTGREVRAGNLACP